MRAPATLGVAWLWAAWCGPFDRVLPRGYYARRMMPQPLPAFADVGPWVDQQRQVRGSVRIADMPRLVELLAEAAGSADVALRFGRDSGRRPVISGRITATLRLTCQRCLQPFDWPMAVDVDIGIVADEKAEESLPDGLDPLIVAGERVRLADVVEDELILGLPVVARHEDNPACQPASRPAGGSDRKVSPFSVLQELRQREGT